MTGVTLVYLPSATATDTFVGVNGNTAGWGAHKDLTKNTGK